MLFRHARDYTPTAEESESLRFQTGTLKTGRGMYGKYLAYAFTEQGVAMLSSVLHSDCAIEVILSKSGDFPLLSDATADTVFTPSLRTGFSSRSD
jgi:hypothetical protein